MSRGALQFNLRHMNREAATVAPANGAPKSAATITLSAALLG
jgi:hypothetical protein